MFNNSPLPFANPNASASGITRFHPDALRLFERMLWVGQVHRLISRLTGRTTRLSRLDDAVRTTTRHAGDDDVIPVNIDQIIGTVSRSSDFDRRFYPMRSVVSLRWVRVASGVLHGTYLPPIELIRVGQHYFVQDGHHRISVARALGHETLDAVVLAVYP
ncbi:MAG: hypothetical protein JNJ61_28565 [Anaerolineae bacterium]|nr:hypothetical protein [Anaerolineae bacterium]